MASRLRRGRVRRAFAQVHLWLALLLGLYVVVISISGSAVVFRGELNRWAVPFAVPSTDGERLTGDALAEVLTRTYPDHTVVRFTEARFPSRPVSVLLERDGVEHGRLFDPFAAADMGESYPRTVRVVEWLVSLHDELLAGDVGRKVNGLLGGLVLVVVVSGAVIWWPGRSRWTQGLYVTPGAPRFVARLHSAVGFWIALLLAVWALSGLYMGFPAPFEWLMNRLDSTPEDFVRPGDDLFRWLTVAHFGRFGGIESRIAWTVLGLAPAVLVCTGWLLWYRRSLRPRLRERQGVGSHTDRATAGT